VTCGIPMEEAETNTGHDLEICDRCGGAWMDIAAFLADLRRAQPRLAAEELMEHNDGTPRRPCPVCKEPMSIVWIEFLQLDQCHEHGLWFDPGELDRALKGDVVPAEIREVLHKALRQRPKR
jgi:Zn-finger nucleic acid-binding protein